MQYTHQKFTFRQVTPDDLVILYRWFKEPHIEKWWPVPETYEDFFEQFLVKIRSKDTFPFIVYMHDVPFGYIQYYHVDGVTEKTGADWPEFPQTTVGIDQFIGDVQSVGKGYGVVFIKEFLEYLSSELTPWVTTVVLDPSPDNKAAIRCYEKVGFKPVGVYITASGYINFLMRYDIDKK